MWRRRLMGFAWCVALCGCGGPLEPPARTFDEARLIISEQPDIPDDSDPRWQNVRLPDYWSLLRRRVGLTGWYRVTFDLPERPQDIWAVYLPTTRLNVIAYVNGDRVGDGGRFEEPIARNRNRPLLFTVPANTLHAGRNVVDLRLRTTEGTVGILGPFVLAPEDAVRPFWARRELIQVTLIQVLSVMTVAMGFLLLSAFAGRGSPAANRWLAASMLLWTFAGAETWIRDVPLPTHLWEWLSSSARNWTVLCFYLGLRRLYAHPRDLGDVVLLTVWSGFTAAVAMVPAILSLSVGFFWACGTMTLLSFMPISLWRAARAGRIRRGYALPLAVGTGAAFVLHDMLSMLSGRLLAPIPLAPYITAVAVLGVGSILFRQLVDALATAEDLNVTLERRVREKSAALEETWTRVRDLERERAVVAERERITRDIHDGLGGHLVSTLALVEGGGFTPSSVADALRDALDDLRLVIDSLDPSDDDLVSVLATVRGRLEPRLQRHGIRIEWQVSDLPPLPQFGPERVLRALRIVQEAITNIIKHAAASTITVRTGEAANADGRPGVFVEVADDGHGFATPSRAGRGLRNMQRRAEELRGVVDVRSAAGGTTVRLWLPRDAAA